MPETHDGRPWQFSIGAVVVVTFLIAVSLSFHSWIGLIGSLVVLGALGGLALAMRGFLTKQRWVTAIGLCMITTSILALLYDMTYVILWSGRYTLSVHFDVVEANTGQPVPGAQVSVTFEPEYAQNAIFVATTNADGRADWMGKFRTGGRVSSLGITAPDRATVISLNVFAIGVEAEGFEPTSLLLSEATGEEQWSADGKFLNATVRLLSTPTAFDSGADPSPPPD